MAKYVSTAGVKLQIEQYFHIQDYALWDVIENGNSFKPVVETIIDDASTSTGPITIEEKAKTKNDVKARSMLLMAFPNENLMTFNQYKDAKTLFATIETRFDRNEATKKTQKTLLKNKLYLDTMSLDDLYNNFKIVEQELSMRAKRFFQKNSKKITINGSDTAGYDKAKVECFNYHRMGHFAREYRVSRNQENRTRNQETTRWTVNVKDTSSKAMVAIDGAEVYTDNTCCKTCLKNYATLKTQYDELRVEFNKSKCYLADYKRGLALVKAQLAHYQKNERLLNENIDVLKRDIKIKDSEIIVLKSKLEKISNEKDALQTKIKKFENASQILDKLIGIQFTNKSKKVLGYVSYNAVPSPHTGRFSPLRIDLSYTGLPEFAKPSVQSCRVKPIEVVTQKSSVKISAHVKENNGVPLIEEWESDEEDEVKSPLKKERKTVEPSVDKIEREKMVNETNHSRVNHNANTVPKAMLTRIGLKPVISVTPVNPKRNFQRRAAYNNRNFFKKVNTAKEKVNTARPNSAVLNAVRENKGKACPSHKQIEDQGYFDSGCSWHMTGNISYLTDFKEFDEGYVKFGGGAKGGKITGKGTIRPDTECFVLSHDFKLANESHVLLKAPRKNNLYSVDMKNIDPKKDLTCLVEKATNDESMLWHKKLGIKREYSIARTPQQNKVAERRNKTLIEAARTMLADSKLPITFWAEAVNTACYVQNRVLVVKPHFKTPYELFRDRTPALSFMKPFGCHVTILNTLDHLGKFDGKSDEGFFVGYSTNSKAFRVYNTTTRKVEENLHIKFLENKPSIEKGASFDAGQSSMETGPSQDYILMPLWNDGSLFDSSSKDSDGDNQDNVGPINTVRLSDDFFGAANFMRSLDGVELDISNISTTYLVPTTPNTRINKDHSLDNVIGDIGIKLPLK
nr:retrovirus-related Pol polyprotein from transposon TNT 1-94 [Tanacetum cinerariifolium]